MSRGLGDVYKRQIDDYGSNIELLGINKKKRKKELIIETNSLLVNRCY